MAEKESKIEEIPAEEATAEENVEVVAEDNSEPAILEETEFSKDAPEEVKSPPRLEDDYFTDDEKVIEESLDTLLDSTDRSALIQQFENVVTWHLDGFYDDLDRPFSRRHLRLNPPALVIEASDGNRAEFVLTEKVAQSLSEITTTVHRGYFGVSPKKQNVITQREAQGRLSEVQDWFLAHPFRATFTVIILVAVVIFAIAS